MRLALARLRPAQPLDIEAEPALEIVGVAQLRRVVAIERDDERALVAVADRQVARAFQLAREIRPQPLAFQRQRQQLLLARLGLDRRRQHAGRRPARAVPGFAPVVHGDPAAGLGQAPGDGEANDPGADDDRLRALL